MNSHDVERIPSASQWNVNEEQYLRGLRPSLGRRGCVLRRIDEGFEDPLKNGLRWQIRYGQ